MNGTAMNCSREGLTAICIHVISQKKDNSIFNIVSDMFYLQPNPGAGTWGLES